MFYSSFCLRGFFSYWVVFSSAIITMWVFCTKLELIIPSSFFLICLPRFFSLIHQFLSYSCFFSISYYFGEFFLNFLLFRSLWLFFLISSFLFAFSYSHIYLSYFFFIIINAFYHSSLFFFVRCCSFAPPCFFFWFVLFYSVFFITIIFSLASSFFLIYFSIFFYYFLLFFSSSYFHDRTCSFLLSHSDLFLPRFFFELR